MSTPKCLTAASARGGSASLDDTASRALVVAVVLVKGVTIYPVLASITPNVMYPIVPNITVAALKTIRICCTPFFWNAVKTKGWSARCDLSHRLSRFLVLRRLRAPLRRSLGAALREPGAGGADLASSIAAR